MSTTLRFDSGHRLRTGSTRRYVVALDATSWDAPRVEARSDSLDTARKRAATAQSRLGTSRAVVVFDRVAGEIVR